MRSISKIRNDVLRDWVKSLKPHDRSMCMSVFEAGEHVGFMDAARLFRKKEMPNEKNSR